MSDPSSRHAVDYEALSDILRAIAYPVRLELLGLLRTKRSLRELRVAPRRSASGEGGERAAALQTIQAHLDKLVESELVRVEPAEREGRELNLFVANPSKLYVVIEALRALMVRYAGFGLEPENTATVGEARPRAEVKGPRLVLVHGVYEGKAFELSGATATAGAWTIGRAKGLAVSLDYDPFVSHETAVVTREGNGFAITDLGSKNGTWLNWALLAAGERRGLKPADVIGIGRSLLVFAAE